MFAPKMTVTLVRYFQAFYNEFWREKFKFKKNEKVTRFARYDMIFFVDFVDCVHTITKPLYYFMVELSHMILAVGITMPRWSWLSASIVHSSSPTSGGKNELFLCMFIANHASGHQKSLLPSSTLLL